MLTPQEMQEMDTLTGIKAVPAVSPNVSTRLAELKSLRQPKKTSIAEKIGSFTGGTKIAQGLGQALAQKETGELIQQTQQSQADIQGQLVQKIKEFKTAGKDTKRLEGALEDLNMDIDTTGQGAERQLNPEQLTTKQVVGDALQLGTNLATVGTLGGAGAKPTGVLSKIPGLTKTGEGVASKLATKVVGSKAGVLPGAARGAIALGAEGVVGGGLRGTAKGLKEDKDAIGVLKEAGKEALIEGIGGAVLGTVGGGISGGIKSAKGAKESTHLKAVTPNTKDLSTQEYEMLVRQGRITPKTATTPDQYILSGDEIATAEKYKSILGKDPVKNTQALLKEIAKKDDEVGKFLKTRNGIFNTGELKNSLTIKLNDLDDLTVSEEKLVKAKKTVIDSFIKSLKKNDMESLWKARKEFDRKIESAFRGSPTLQKEIKKEFRNGIQDFISERTDNTTYKGFMKEMSKLFDLADITDTKAVKDRGMNAVQEWIKDNPGKASLVKWLGGTGIVGTVGYQAIK